MGQVGFEPATRGDITRTLPQTPPFFKYLLNKGKSNSAEF